MATLKGPKMIDLTKDKTAPEINKFVTRVNKLFAQYLKKSNVTVFSAIAKNASAETYFLDHDMYKSLFGDIGIQLYDQCFLTAFNTIITDDLVDGIDAVSFVGLWDQHNVYDIVSRVTTIMTGDEDGKLYFTAQQYHSITKEDLEKLPEGSYMPFDEFNPNRFYQQSRQIIQVTYNVMLKIIDNRWPKLNYKPINGTTVNRSLFYATFGAYLRDFEFKKIELNTPYQERTIRQFVDTLDRPFMTMISAMMENSGLSTATVLNFLSSVKIHMLYGEPESNKTGDTVITMMLVAENMKDRPGVTFEITIKDIVGCYETCVEGSKEIAARINRFDRGIKKFINDACMLAIRTYIESLSSEDVQES